MKDLQKKINIHPRGSAANDMVRGSTTVTSPPAPPHASGEGSQEDNNFFNVITMINNSHKSEL